MKRAFLFITPAFPKLVYVLNNIREGGNVLASDTSCCTVYCKANGSGLYFRKDHEALERGEIATHGIPF